MMHPREVSKVDFTWIFRKSKKFSVCFKIICNACRTVLIQSALCYPDPGDCFRYPQHVCNIRRNFSRELWSSRVCSTKGVNGAFKRSFKSWFYMIFSRKKTNFTFETSLGFLIYNFSPPEVAALCPSCVMFPSHKPTTKVSRHVPNWGDWRPKSTNLTKSLNSTRPTEGTFSRPHVVFCFARYPNFQIWTSILPVRRLHRLYAIANLRTSRHSSQTFWTDRTIIFGIQHDLTGCQVR